MCDYAAKASELVCVAIGVNLLFPIAPNILQKFLRALKADTEKVFQGLLGDVKFLRERDISELNELSTAILEEQKRCMEGKLGWPVIDVVAVIIGILLLWTGLVDFLGGWCILLFLPAVVAVIQAWWKYRPWKKRCKETASQIRMRIRVRREDAEAQGDVMGGADGLTILQKEISKFLEAQRAATGGK